MMARTTAGGRAGAAAASALMATAASVSTLALSPGPTAGCAPALPGRPVRLHASSTLTPGAAAAEPMPFRIDLTALGEEVAAVEAKRQRAYDMSREISVALVRARAAMESSSSGADEEAAASEAELDRLVRGVLTEAAGESAAAVDRTPREANLSYRMEDYIRFKALRHFLDTGTLLPPSCHPKITDEEYLGGACIGLAQDLARYAVARATVRDVGSVQMAREIVGDVLDQLLLFDFRNGPLRRKYDGTKYAMKQVETIMYELSVTGADVDAGGSSAAAAKGVQKGEDDEDEPEAKRARVDDDQPMRDGVNSSERPTAPSRIPVDELSALRLQMEHRDELRERLIKACRDGQKAAKQSIFALHRGDTSRALKLLSQCESCVRSDLLPIIEEEPGLRYGSFSNVMEEYAEARLFFSWLHGPSSSESEGKSHAASPVGRILGPKDFPLSLNPEEYLGGLCDLTGEIGRYAVKRGTARDAEGVRKCLETNSSISTALQLMARLPGGIGKKSDALRWSVEKLERMLYELSLVEATGRKSVATHVGDDEPEAARGGGDGEDR